MSQKAQLQIWNADCISLDTSQSTQLATFLQTALTNRPPISKLAELGYIIMDNPSTEEAKTEATEVNTEEPTTETKTQDIPDINATKITVTKPETETKNDSKTAESTDTSPYAMGDYVQLSDGTQGIVKYIGTTDFAKGQLLGLELLTPDDEGLDGTRNGKTYFECKPSHGHWTRTEKITVHSKTIPENTQSMPKSTDNTENNTEANDTLSPLPNTEANMATMSYYERFSSVSDWQIPDSILEEAKRLDQVDQDMSNNGEYLDDSVRADNKSVAVNIGDRIITAHGYTGVVRFRGNVHFEAREVIGIELDQWNALGHNGIVEGHTYFSCTEGRGLFVLRNGGIDSNLGATVKRRKSSVLMNVSELKMLSDLKADEHKVELGGIKRQIAKIEKKLREIQALEEQGSMGEALDTSQMSKIERKKHLKVKLGALTKEMMDINKANDTGPKAPMPKVTFNVGDRVKLERGKTGIVKFIGGTQFAKGEVIGLELDTWTPAGHNGTVRGKIYFDAQDGRGYFTRRSNILNVVLPLVKPLHKRRLSVKYKLNPLMVKDKVRVLSEDKSINSSFWGRSGVVKYIGYPQFANGEVIGIELDEWCINAHNGTAHGVQVFEAAPGRGVFLRRDEMEKYDPEKEKLEEIKKNLKLGDTVILTNNRKGHVKYIGPVTGYDEMIGVELESWSPEAKDGRYDGFRYFTAPDGRGIFIKRRAIMDVIPLEAIQQTDDDDDGKYMSDDESDTKENSLAQPSVGDRIKLTKGRFGKITAIDTMDDGTLEYQVNIAQLIDRTLLTKQIDIAHKRQHSMADGVRRNSLTKAGGLFGGLGPKSTRQSGLLDIEDMKGGKQLMSGAVDDDSDNYDSDDDNYTALGETIELRSGKIGTIRFIGPVHFAKGNWIGVELHDHFGPHDGAVRGVRYFTCPAKRGIFVKQIKGRKKDDPTRQHLKRRCPECYGEFIKKRDPRAAYKTVGIVCDGCSKHGNEFSSNDWYFQCGQCEQTDFCLKCMLKLPIVDSDDMLDSYQNIRAKFKPLGTEWIFEDIHYDSEDDNGDNPLKSIVKRNSKFQAAPIKDIFSHFDTDKDGKLMMSDIEDIYKASQNELDKDLFADNTPMKYEQFEQCWKDVSPAAAQNILEFMATYARPKSIGDDIQVLEKVRDVFDHFDSDMDGVLSATDMQNMMLLIDINWEDNGTETKLLFDSSCDYIKFLGKIQRTSAVIVNNILEQLLLSIHLRIEDVFNMFCDSNSKLMIQYTIMNENRMRGMYIECMGNQHAWMGKFAVPCKLDSFMTSWFSIECDEKQCILNETKRRMNRRLMSVFNHFDWDCKGTLNKEQIQEILQLINIGKNGNKLFKNASDNGLSFEMFKNSMYLLQKSLTSDILPPLEQYIREQSDDTEEEKEERKEPQTIEVITKNDDSEIVSGVIEVKKDAANMTDREQWNLQKSLCHKLIDELQNKEANSSTSTKCINSFNSLLQFFDGVIDRNEFGPSVDVNASESDKTNEILILKQQNNKLMERVKALETQLSANASNASMDYEQEMRQINLERNQLQNERSIFESKEREFAQKQSMVLQREKQLTLENENVNELRNELEQQMREVAKQHQSHETNSSNNEAYMEQIKQELEGRNSEMYEMNNKHSREMKEKEMEIQRLRQEMEQSKSAASDEYRQKESGLNSQIDRLQQRNDKLSNDIVSLKESESELTESVFDLRTSKFKLINSTSQEIDALRHKIKMYTNRNWNGLISPVPK